MTNNLEALRSKKLFVLDMDGTFYLGDKLIDGSLDFIEKLKAKNRGFLFFTNNSSKNSKFYKKKLANMGCFVEEQTIVTSGDVTIKYLKENYPDAGVYLVGTEMLVESFKSNGIRLTENNPDIVVFGFDTTLTYEKVSKACTYIRNGALFLATHIDYNCPTENGFIPDCGSMCAMVESSTGKKPKFLGKPFRETVDMIKLITGMGDDELAFVGDRLYTDIAVGVRNGITGILVLTGETRIEDVEKSDVKPDYIFDSLSALGRVL
ncbi:HAD family hydrolase [Clostridium thermosuccinogenes]|uniref:Acid sugar phosphatase n=1 Tax=Clostridium thermosuccinogenes TaxID=84032 RepID=A0A2K2FL71_9CLOT|nr:HAD-IIA family hydrolase [Pseudoclostridium thermosuccinogenes]AUS97622.1 HAD family hydrolase [Pseudoclostridium thermosuccinogenes]PNT93876.1 HAD family hydrolase [Pseudoclostridium thermosuccinogenes]PNT97487.1 HAD family hydrolase [Pseudoclostridium thermosuccinogenes]PNT99518.1 HAD family hydrolase [Pseudoclostridium thermosuccinogenes]